MLTGSPVFGAPGVLESGSSRGERPQLRLLIADRCNLRCSYCHFHATNTDRDKMAPETAADRIREFARVMQARGHNAADLSLYGGEPLVNPQAVRTALDTVDALRADGFDFSVVINSNGTLITDEWAKMLAMADVDAHISLDGPDEVANAERSYINRASWPDVMRGLGALQKAGCRTQLNTVLTTTNIGRLEELIDLAATQDIRRIFIALPDGAFTADQAPQAARRLTEARAWAESRRVAFFGPWSVSDREERPAPDWPPLNLVIRPPGALFFPYLPWHEFGSVEGALSAPGLADEWQTRTLGCDACPIRARCHGYLKMMVAYHTGGKKEADLECAVANAVAEIIAGDSSENAILQTTLDLRLGRIDNGGSLIANALIEDSVREVSDDTVSILDWFAGGASRASAHRQFDATNLDAALDALIECGIVSRPDDDTDMRLLEALAAEGSIRRGIDFVLGAGEGVGDGWAELLVTLLERCAARLPPALRLGHAPIHVLGVANREVLAQILGEEDGTHHWMIGTVFFSIVLIDVETCLGILECGGRARLKALEDGLTHELCHVALRKAGLHLPIWLEEGICEHLSKPETDPARLRASAYELDRFKGFVLDPLDPVTGVRSPFTNLLAFSPEPPEDNPAYLLVRDLVAWLDREAGLSGLLESWQRRGASVALAPFPVDPESEGIIAASLDTVLEEWSADVEARIASVPTFNAPLRLIESESRALVYNRMVGGMIVLPASAKSEALAGRNLTLDQIAPLLGPDAAAEPTWRRWRGEVFPQRRGRHLRLALEQGCNMGCSYCYESDKQMRPMSVEVADQALSKWRDLLRPEDLGRSTIRFFGGEPLLNWPVMGHVLAQGDLGLPSGSVAWVVNTNGTQLRDFHVDAFRQKGDRLEVSLSCDGVGDDHDAVRMLRGGQGTFDAVDRAMNMLAEAGVPLAVAVVVGLHNKDGLKRLAEYTLALRQRYDAPVRLALEPLIGGHFTAEQEAGLVQAHREVLTFCMAEGLPATGKMFYGFEGMMDQAGASGHFCSVTGAELSVGPDGELLVCHAIDESAYGHLDSLGDATDIPLPEIYAARSAGNLPECGGCAVEGLCGGGCMAQSIAVTGRPDGTPGNAFCDLMRGTFHDLVTEYLRHDGP